MSIYSVEQYANIYNEYRDYINTDNLTLSAYNVLNHFFTKFEDSFQCKDQIKLTLDKCNIRLQESFATCAFDFRLFYVDNIILEGEEKKNVLRHMGMVEHIVKHKIFKLTDKYETYMNTGILSDYIYRDYFMGQYLSDIQ
jgi:hypothetical protein